MEMIICFVAKMKKIHEGMFLFSVFVRFHGNHKFLSSLNPSKISSSRHVTEHFLYIPYDEIYFSTRLFVENTKKIATRQSFLAARSFKYDSTFSARSVSLSRQKENRFPKLFHHSTHSALRALINSIKIQSKFHPFRR